MTGTELVHYFRSLAPPSLDPDLICARLLLRYLADQVYEARTADGRSVRDISDISTWLRELADEARKIAQISPGTNVPFAAESRPGPKVTTPLAQLRYDSSLCPDCGHEHEGREECAKYLGEGKFCHCSSKVAA